MKLVYLMPLLTLLYSYWLFSIKSTKTYLLVSWMGCFSLVGCTYFLVRDLKPLVSMILLISVALLSIKPITYLQTTLITPNPMRFKAWFVYQCLWFGMNPEPFLNSKSRDSLNGIIDLKQGLSTFLVGLGVLVLSHLCKSNFIVHASFGLIGLSLMLHFGILRLQVACCKYLGFDVSPLFNTPLFATSLKDFWGKRWNLAFRDMISICIYKPIIKSTTNKTLAVLLSFIASGILHEMAITLPSQSMYGTAFIYFCIQFSGLYLEERLHLSTIQGRLFTFLFILFPIPLLFNSAFIKFILP